MQFACGSSALFAHVSLYSAALGLAFCCAEVLRLQAGLLRHRREPRADRDHIVGELGLGGVPIQSDDLHTQKPAQTNTLHCKYFEA